MVWFQIQILIMKKNHHINMKKNNPFSKSIAIVLCTLSLLLTTTTQFDVIPALVLQGKEMKLQELNVKN